MEERPCSSCQTRPAATKLPGTEGLFGQSKHPRASDFFCSVQDDLQRSPFCERNDASLGKWEAGSTQKLLFSPQLLASRLGSILYHFTPQRTCLRLASQKSHLASGGQSLSWVSMGQGASLESQPPFINPLTGKARKCLSCLGSGRESEAAGCLSCLVCCCREPLQRVQIWLQLNQAEVSWPTTVLQSVSENLKIQNLFFLFFLCVHTLPRVDTHIYHIIYSDL